MIESMNDRFRIVGKVAIVTGASSGLGVGCATMLAEAGADLVLVGRRLDRLDQTASAVRARGRRALVVPADVGSPEACASVVDQAVREFGAVDILVNNAGVASARPATRELPQEFEDVVRVNLMGSYWMAQSCGRVMRPGSSIVNVSSVLAVTTLGLPQAAYSSSKAGVLGLTRDLARQWSGRKGIRVNAVLPGLIRSEMLDEYDDQYLAQLVADRSVIGRLGDQEECAAGILFLASPAASYITGVGLPIDGGMLLT
jgi:NAD(P)-dependent dehydrogenase (short-subunit alcohol dehydrogenase family)